jgi:hypothetical protein
MIAMSVPTCLDNCLQRHYAIPPELKSIIRSYLRQALLDNTLKGAVLMWFDEHQRRECVLKFGQISDWDTSNVTNMDGLFVNKIRFSEPLNDWNVSNVTSMKHMFFFCFDFNQPLDKWSVGRVTNMTGMFHSTLKFNQPISTWNTSSVEDMNGMFSFAMEFNQPLNSWDVANVKDFTKMFYKAGFKPCLDGWRIASKAKVDMML